MIDQDRPNVEERPWPPDEVPWSLLNLDELADAYWAYVAPAARRDGIDTDCERPSYEWLSKNGFRGLIYSLSEYHDTTFGKFWSDVLELSEEDEGYDWDIEDEETLQELKQFIDRRRESRSNWTESTVRTNRYRLARYARAYRHANGTDDLLTPVSPDSDAEPYEANQECWKAFDELTNELSRVTAYRIYRSAEDWYRYLIAIGRAETNPTEHLAREYGWHMKTPESDSPSSLSTEHVQSMIQAADSTRDKLMLTALCAWGLRSGEVAELHADQLEFGEQSYIHFEERKNGPGTVTIVYGEDVVKDRIGELDSDDWNGYLFPSSRSQTGHVARQTVTSWFRDLADAAGVPEEIDGDTRKPHMGRRYWYNRYSETLEDILDFVGDIAEEQGSASPRVVMDNYLSDERKRELRRRFMRERLSEAFE